jgi:phosphoenolpyruvate---glycerone phosphotransferase subunit DhaM
VIGIVLVSHSAQLAEGLAELLRQIAADGVSIEAAGGGPDGSLGTDGARIAAAARCADRGDGVVLLADIGSAVLSVRALIAGRDLDSGRAVLADAPLVEGSVAAAVAASTGMNLGGVVAAASEAWDVRKL